MRLLIFFLLGFPIVIYAEQSELKTYSDVDPNKLSLQKLRDECQFSFNIDMGHVLCQPGQCESTVVSPIYPESDLILSPKLDIYFSNLQEFDEEKTLESESKNEAEGLKQIYEKKTLGLPKKQMRLMDECLENLQKKLNDLNSETGLSQQSSSGLDIDRFSVAYSETLAELRFTHVEISTSALKREAPSLLAIKIIPSMSLSLPSRDSFAEQVKQEQREMLSSIGLENPSQLEPDKLVDYFEEQGNTELAKMIREGIANGQPIHLNLQMDSNSALSFLENDIQLNSTKVNVSGLNVKVENITDSSAPISPLQPKVLLYKITPNMENEHELLVSVSVSNSAKEDFTSDWLSIKLKAKWTTADRLLGFFESNWQWLIVTFMLPIVGYFWKKRFTSDSAD